MPTYHFKVKGNIKKEKESDALDAVYKALQDIGAEVRVDITGEQT